MTWHTVERAVFDNNGEWCEDMYGSGYFIRDDKLYVHVLLGQGKTETRYVCTKSEFIQKRNRMLHEAFFGDAPRQNLADRDAEVAKKAFVAGVNWWADVCAKSILGHKVYTPTTQEKAREYANQLLE